MDAIKIQNLTKFYGKARGIQNIDLTIGQGDFFGFIGPNGAGKSTTIRSLTGFLKPGSGSCSIFGADCWKEKEKVLSNIGYLPSENAFYSGMRVRDILKLSADLRKKDCSKEAMRLGELLQLDFQKKASELSFGNRKKLSIICALQHDPQLLILDEPTGGLDPLMQKAFFDILDERHKKGTTIFFSSHILSEVQKHCDRAAIIKNGRIIACDKVDALKQTSVKKITLSGDFREQELNELEQVRKLQAPEGLLCFFYGGSIEKLLSLLAGRNIQDLTIQEPDLEEVFMHYYEEV